MSEELKPCPFCGGEAEIHVGAVAFVDCEISCTKCGVNGGNYGAMDLDHNNAPKHRAEAIAAWNTRADLLPVVKPLVWRLVEERTSFARCRYVADTFIIEHRLHGEHFDLFLRPSATAATRFDTLEAAKAAAQADYEARIRACLDMTDPLKLVAGAYEAAISAVLKACNVAGSGYKDENERLLRRAEREAILSSAKAIRALTPADAQAALDAAIAKAVNEKLDEVIACVALLTLPRPPQPYVTAIKHVKRTILAMKEPE